jgi:hypothetical protein
MDFKATQSGSAAAAEARGDNIMQATEEYHVNLGTEERPGRRAEMPRLLLQDSNIN